MDGHQPDCFDPEIIQIVEFGRDAVEIAYAVVVRVIETAYEDFVENRLSPPA